MLKKFTMKEKEREIILFILGLVAISLAVMICYANKPGLWIEDEFGYFGSAAFFMGFDWKQLYGQMGYYGFGYGILLIPGFLLCRTSQALIIYMLCINALLLLGSYFFTVRLIRILFPLEDKILLYTGIVISILYINNIVQLHMGWSETLNLFLYWWVLNAFYDVISSNKIHNYIEFSCVLCFLIMVHMRNITVVTPCLFMLIIYLLKKRNFNKKGIGLFILIAVCGAVLFFGLKKYIQYNLYSVNDGSQVNDIVSSIGIFGFLRNIDWFYFLSKGSLAKTFYIFSSTYFLFGFGFVGSIKSYIEKKNINSELRKYVIALAFWIFSFSFILCVINSAIPSRMDSMFYGRYYEPYIGMLLIIGFFALNNVNDTIGKKIFHFIILGLIYKISFINTENYFIQSLPGFQGYFTFPCVTGIAKYFNMGILNSEIVASIFRETLKYPLLFAILIAIQYLYHSRQNIKRLLYLIFALCIVIGQVNDAREVVDWMQAAEEDRYEAIDPLLEIIAGEWDEQKKCEIYYFMTGTPSNPQADILAFQFKLGKTPIQVIDEIADINQLDHSKYIIINKKESNYVDDKNVIESLEINFRNETEFFELYSID